MHVESARCFHIYIIICGQMSDIHIYRIYIYIEYIYIYRIYIYIYIEYIYRIYICILNSIQPYGLNKRTG